MRSMKTVPTIGSLLMRLRAVLPGCVVLFAGLALGSAGTRAGTISDVSYFTKSAGPVAALSGGTFGFLDDGVPASPGLQEVDLFVNESLPVVFDLLIAGSLTISGLDLSGPAVDDGFGTYLQPLTGGTFAMYGAAGETLLSGSLGDAYLLFEVGLEAAALEALATYTGGTMLPYLPSTSGALVMLLLDITPVGGLEAGQMAPFSAASSQGTFSVTPVPEPSTLVLGVLAMIALRRVGTAHRLLS